MTDCKPTVYVITNVINGKKYVGCTIRDVQQRLREHELAAQRPDSNDHYMLVVRAISKHGIQNFMLVILSTHSSLKEMFDAEKQAIIEHKTFVGDFPELGYNLTRGGEGCPGRIVSSGTRALISKNAKIRYESGFGAYMRSCRKSGKDHFFHGKNWGRKTPHTEESKKKMRLAKLGKTHTTEHNLKISESCKGRLGPNLGKPWSVSTRINQSYTHYLRKKPVFGFNIDGERVVSYFSINDAAIATGLSPCVFYNRRLQGIYKKSLKYFDGVTYVRSEQTIAELKKGV